MIRALGVQIWETVLLLRNLPIQGWGGGDRHRSKKLKSRLMLEWEGLRTKSGPWREVCESWCGNPLSLHLQTLPNSLWLIKPPRALPVPVSDARSMSQPTDWCSAWIGIYISVQFSAPSLCPHPREANKTLVQIHAAQSVPDSWTHHLLLPKDHATPAPDFYCPSVPTTSDPR